MTSFYIESITATGVGKTLSRLTFSPGLNIICGASDTGKTAVLKSIKFIFGHKDKPFSPETGFNTITMNIVTPNGPITISRTIGKSTVTVNSQVNFISSGIYDCEYNSNGNKNPILNTIWLTLLGIKNTPMLISNSTFSKKRLTFLTFLRSFYLNEDNIGNIKSIMLPSESTTVTLFLSSLIYLFTNNDFSEAETQDKSEISRAKKMAVENFAKIQLQEVAEKSKNLKSNIDAYNEEDIELKIQTLVEKLTSAEASIKLATEKSKTLLSELLKYKEKEAEYEVVYSQYQALKTQYISDINRLTLITEGDTIMSELPPNNTCPFCNSSITPEHHESHMQAYGGELLKIIGQLQGLTESENDIISELGILKNKVTTLEKEHTNIQELIDTKLSPKANELKMSISKYRSFIENQNELRVLEDISKDIHETMIKETFTPPKKEKFKPKAHFPSNFERIISDYAFEILKECKYQDLTSAYFDLNSFDLIVNGKPKGENHGKGYRAFINTALGLAFKRYYRYNAIYNPGLFIVDSPLLGLDQGVDIQTPDSMKKGLLNYFLNHAEEGQAIIVENSNYLPNLDFEGYGANVIEFTHGNSKSKYKQSRYGYLVGVEGSDKTP